MIFDIAHDLATVSFVVTGILGMLCIPSCLTYWILNSMYKKGKVLQLSFEYVRYRKEFKRWYKFRKGEKLKPVRKPRIRRDDE